MGLCVAARTAKRWVLQHMRAWANVRTQEKNIIYLRHIKLSSQFRILERKQIKNKWSIPKKLLTIFTNFRSGFSMKGNLPRNEGERGGSVVECRTPEREVRGSKPTAAVLCPWARHFTPRKYWLLTQEAMAPSRYDWKIVDWDVKPQHNQPTRVTTEPSKRNGITAHSSRLVTALQPCDRVLPQCDKLKIEQ